MDEYMVGDVVSVLFHGSDTEGEILKIYPSGAVLLAPLYYDEEFGRECIVVEPQDIEYVIESIQNIVNLVVMNMPIQSRSI